MKPSRAANLSNNMNGLTIKSQDDHESITDTELDITDYRWISAAYGESTDELLTSEIRTEWEEGAVSTCETTSIDERTTSSYGEGSISSEPVILHFDLAEPRKTKPNRSPRSNSSRQRGI